MMLVDNEIEDPESSWEFEADVQILQQAATIKSNYQAVIHCGVIR